MADVDWAGFAQRNQQNSLGNQLGEGVQKFAQGFQIGGLMRQNNALNQARELEAKKEQQLLARTQALQTTLGDLSKVTDPYERVQGLNNVMLQFPEVADKLKTQAGFYSDQVKENATNALLPALNALNLGNKDVAINRLTTAAEAFKNSGNTRGAEALNAYIDDIKGSTEVAPLVQSGYLTLASILGPDKLADTLKNSQEYSKTQANLPGEIKKAAAEVTSAEQKALQEVSTTAIKAEEAVRAPIETALKTAERDIKETEAKTKEQVILADLALKRQQLSTARANEAQSRQSITESKARTDKLYSVQKPADANKVVDLGLPIPARVPWSNLVDGKERDKMMAAVYKAADKDLNKKSASVSEVISVVPDVDRFIALNEKIPTGGVLDRTGAGRGLYGLTSAEYDEMRSISAKLAPRQRPEGAGATSDFDAKQYERATVGVDKPLETNKNIASALKARAQSASDYQEFLQDYLTQNGTLADAERNWKEYSNKNPVLDPNKPGTYTLNTKRLPWQTYFAIQAEKQARGIK